MCGDVKKPPGLPVSPFGSEQDDAKTPHPISMTFCGGVARDPLKNPLMVGMVPDSWTFCTLVK